MRCTWARTRHSVTHEWPTSSVQTCSVHGDRVGKHRGGGVVGLARGTYMWHVYIYIYMYMFI